MRRTTAVLYSTAVCNLNCTYCYINKNKGLSAIDRLLAESFSDPDYYFEFIRDYFPHRGDLQNLEVWGAETFLHMERVHPTIHKLVEHYPFFRRFFASTNFSYPEWTDKVFDLLGQFAGYAPRRFEVTLQLSLDGPAHITDATRGQGVTEKCLENFDRLLARAGEIPGNVNLFLAFKGGRCMTLAELLGWGGGGLFLLLTLVQVAPVKLNPWSALAGLIGRAVNREVHAIANIGRVYDDRLRNHDFL